MTAKTMFVFYVFSVRNRLAKKKGALLEGDVPVLDSSLEQAFEIRLILLWQAITVLIVSLLAALFSLPWLSVLIGGLGVLVSTWHVQRSVYRSGGEKVFLLKAAGLRFALFLLLMAAAVFFLGLQPMAMIVGMAVAYIAMYVRSLMMIVKKMRGVGLG